MAILVTADYPAIRAAIDIGLDAGILPDATIALPPYAPAAVDEVTLRDPLAPTRTDPEQVRLVKAAAIFLCAARLVPAVPLLSSEQVGQSYRYNRIAIDPMGLVAELRAQASQSLQLVLDPGDLAADKPTFFTVACGGRGR